MAGRDNPNQASRRPVKANKPTAGGPYEAIVINHLDPQYMGTLEVELLKNDGSGNQPERTGQVFTVRYLSPFYGATPQGATTANDGYDFTQKSYGFWAVPPDVGTKVLVIFAEDNAAYGYWIGCIQDQFMNYMVPGSTPSTELTTGATPNPLRGLKLPTAEYNKKIEDGSGRDPTRYLKPYNKDFTQVLEIQGLLKDEFRGTTTSSARREVPSMVFGMSSPGPLDRRPGAPKAPYGNDESKALRFVSRLGGSSLVFDDGDETLIRNTTASEGPPEYVLVEGGQRQEGNPTLPMNELVRLRTRTGHQILLHNSEDLIYIGNSRGTAWIEMTSDGKIDIHSQDSISVMTNADINFTAERDITMEAGRNINLRADGRYGAQGDQRSTTGSRDNGRVQIESRYDTNILTGQDFKHTVVRDSDRTVGGDSKKTVVGDYNVHGSNIYESADTAIGILAGAGLRLTSGAKTDILAGSSLTANSGSNITFNAAGIGAWDASEIYLDSGRSNAAVPAEPAEDAVVVTPLGKIVLPYVTPGQEQPTPYRTIVPRAPQHEPWGHHENLGPLEFKIAKTDRENPGPLPSIQNPINVDTFRKSNASQARPQGTTTSLVNTSGRGVGSTPTRDNLAPSRDRTITAGAQFDPPGEPLPVGDLVGNVDGFNAEETAAYLGAVGQRESTNRYNLVNSIGFAGKYQFGTAALKEARMINDSAPNGNGAMNNPSNWTGQYGCNDLQDWLNNVGNCQEYAMITYTNKNRRYLENNGGIQPNDTKEQIAGMLMGAHLLGASGMRNWRRGRGGADAYGTTGDEYFGIGSTAMANVTGGTVTQPRALT